MVNQATNWDGTQVRSAGKNYPGMHGLVWREDPPPPMQFDANKEY